MTAGGFDTEAEMVTGVDEVKGTSEVLGVDEEVVGLVKVIG